MNIGVPKEIKEEEKRVAITPAGVNALVSAGHKVCVEKNAGAGSGITDEQYKNAGATIVPGPGDAWRCQLVIKVKERSAKTEISTGILYPRCLSVAALNALQNSIMFTPC